MNKWHNIFKISQSGTLQKPWLYVYHRTRETRIASNVCNVGYVAGSGAAYGVGIYNTYDLKSQMVQSMMTTYGPVIIKSMVNVYGFLILDRRLAEDIYGSGHSSIVKQIEDIIGYDTISQLDHNNNPVSFDNRKKDSIYHFSNRLEKARYSSDVASSLCSQLGLDRTNLKGICYTGRTDGHVLLAYKETEVIPLEYAIVHGAYEDNPDAIPWKKCPMENIEELKKISTDSKANKDFLNSRRMLSKIIKQSGENDSEINIPDFVFNSIPKTLLKQILLGISEEDFNFKNRLFKSEITKNKINSLFGTDFNQELEQRIFLRKIRQSPELYWEKWQNLPEEEKGKISPEIQNEIKERFLDRASKYPILAQNVNEETKKLIVQRRVNNTIQLIDANVSNINRIEKDIEQYVKNYPDISNVVKNACLDYIDGPFVYNFLADVNQNILKDYLSPSEMVEVWKEYIKKMPQDVSKLPEFAKSEMSQGENVDILIQSILKDAQIRSNINHARSPNQMMSNMYKKQFVKRLEQLIAGISEENKEIIRNKLNIETLIKE